MKEKSNLPDRVQGIVRYLVAIESGDGEQPGYEVLVIELGQ